MVQLNAVMYGVEKADFFLIATTGPTKSFTNLLSEVIVNTVEKADLFFKVHFSEITKLYH